MIANINWNATNTGAGIVNTSGMFHRFDSLDPGAAAIAIDRGSGVTADEALESEELRRVAEQIRHVVAECHRVAV